VEQEQQINAQLGISMDYSNYNRSATILESTYILISVSTSSILKTSLDECITMTANQESDLTENYASGVK
jgi:hypothetical protein